MAFFSFFFFLKKYIKKNDFLINVGGNEREFNFIKVEDLSVEKTMEGPWDWQVEEDSV